MWNLIPLTLLTIFSYIRLKTLWDKELLRIKHDYDDQKRHYEGLLKENTKVRQDNFDLEKNVQATLALYDITKDLCKSLEEDKIFAIFKDEMNKYIEVNDCKFIKGDVDISQYKDYTVLPLKIDKHVAGYLAAGGIKEEDKNKFHILAQQFLSGLKRAVLYQKVQAMAITDSLTGVFSRRYSLRRFQEEIERSRKFKYRFSFLMADIDYFKHYNDRYGHLVGDAILRQIAGLIKENIRQIDLAGRYGGEEFAVILPETDKEQARLVAERIRQSVESRHIKVYDEDLKVTISIGIATFPADAIEAQSLIDKADQALYRAKQAGRNRVCLYNLYSTA